MGLQFSAEEIFEHWGYFPEEMPNHAFAWHQRSTASSYHYGCRIIDPCVPQSCASGRVRNRKRVAPPRRKNELQPVREHFLVHWVDGDAKDGISFLLKHGSSSHREHTCDQHGRFVWCKRDQCLSISNLVDRLTHSLLSITTHLVAELRTTVVLLRQN